jgi:hypothetical protein
MCSHMADIELSRQHEAFSLVSDNAFTEGFGGLAQGIRPSGNRLHPETPANGRSSVMDQNVFSRITEIKLKPIYSIGPDNRVNPKPIDPLDQWDTDCVFSYVKAVSTDPVESSE